MALDDIKGDDWEVRETVHRNLLVAKAVADELRRGVSAPDDIGVLAEFLGRAIGDAAEMLREDMLHHNRIARIA